MSTASVKVLSSDELSRIHAAALRILDEVGMRFDHPGALDILEGAGARIDRATNRAYLPPGLVEACRAQIPSRYTYHGRTPEFDRTVEVGGPIYGRTAGGCPDYVELETGLHRPARIADWREFVRLSDALPNIGAVANQYTSDVPRGTTDVHSCRAMLEAGRKCAVHGATRNDGYRYQIEMLLAVRGTREALRASPLIHNMVAVYNPLYHDEDNAAQILLSIDYGIPLDIAVMSIVGMTSPATLAGTLAQTLAEELGTITLIQSARPGHPCAFFLGPVVGNLRNGEALAGAPEFGLLLAGICQLGTELFGLPTSANGFDSDGFSGAQTMFSKTQNALFTALAGGSMFTGAGTVETIMALSPAQLVIDDELLAIADRWRRGITVTDETLAVDVVKAVGPRGAYLGEDHTLEALRSGELVELRLAERESRRPVWESKGSRTLESRAVERARDILATHEVPPLPDEVLRELKTLEEAADRELLGERVPASSATV
jgi:trimethylamine:corrinoid methyltransferase-like protein